MRHRHGGYYARLLGGAALISLMAAGAAYAEERPNFDISPQPLSSALNIFAAQSNTAVLFAPELTRAKMAPAVMQSSNPEAALTAMLAGTGLTFKRHENTFVILEEGGSPQGESAAGGGAEVEALIVTAQKKEEAIQDVPIAISAFTQKSLDAQKIEGGFDLLKAIPNVTFSKSNFSGYNFSIRGIGTKAVSATTDPGVAVAFNNTTLIVNRLFEQEYFDVERVEVLRGPQGTLYGRNATSGVVNVLSARPRLGEFEGDIKLEGGNYNAMRARGMVNIPVGETLAIRAAGALTKRDGYGINLAAGTADDLNGVSEDVDGRDLWSARVTVGWEPIEAVRVNAMWERFEEDDNRVRTSKQLCHHDAGFDDFDTYDFATETNAYKRTIDFAGTSQGCKAGSLYDQAAFGTPNGASLPYVSGIVQAITVGYSLGGFTSAGDKFGLGGNPAWASVYNPTPTAPRCDADAQFAIIFPIDICQPDPYGGLMQSADLRTIYSLIEPTYRAKADLFELSVDVDITDSLTLTSQTVWSQDEYYASQDYNRFTTLPLFTDSDTACGMTGAPIFDKYGSPQDLNGDGVQDTDPAALLVDCRPGHAGYDNGWYDGTNPENPFNRPERFGSGITSGGVFCDPQLGCSRSLVAQDLSQSKSEQFNQEFRLASNFEGDLNFSLGANFTRFETLNDYYVFINALTMFTHFFPFNTNPEQYFSDDALFCGSLQGRCVYVDPNPLESINGEGHNYFRSANPYELTSSAIFGELYWQATETLKVTLGARMTWDRKVFSPIPSQLLLSDYREVFRIPPGAGPETCTYAQECQVAGTGVNSGEGARGSVPNPDIRQEWREPTGRIIVDWKPDLGFTDETMIYGSLSHGYKGGGANPPNIAPPAGIFNAVNTGVVQPPTFEPEFINAYEVGTKNTLLGGALILNGSAFYYDYTGYQISKIVDRMAVNENFDATIWGLEAEWIYSPTRNLRFNGTFGHLNTSIADGEQSIDLMDRTDGGNRSFTTPDGKVWDRWMVLKPWVSATSNCVIPVDFAQSILMQGPEWDDLSNFGLFAACPFGNIIGGGSLYKNHVIPSLGIDGYDPVTDAPNGGAGFFKDLGGNDLPNAPHWTASLGAQYRLALPGGWDATLRGDFYWQSQSYARVYNTQYDKLRAWTNTNVSLWVENPDWGVIAEVYVKNVFDETPITDAFLNSDDSALTTNVFTLDPRLVGVSVRKSF